MTFTQKMAAFFGFGHEPDLEDDDVPAAEAVPKPQTAHAVAEVSDVELDAEQTRQIFDHVVAMFNDALPSFLAQSVDSEKQKAALYGALDQGVKDYLESVKAAIQANCQAQWAAEREKITAEADALKKRTEELEEKNTKTQEKRMSADRQKRALSERVKDLELQVQKLEAEKEQYEIESKCMVNKTKAVAVLEKEIEDLRSENSDLRSSLQKDADPHAIAANDSELASLKSQLETAQADADAAKAEIEKAKAEAEASKAKAEELQKALDDALAELELVKESMPDGQGITREELEEIEQKLACFEEIKQRLDSRIEKLKESLRTAQKQIKSLQKANVEAMRAHAAEVKQLRDELAAKAVEAPIEDAPKSALADELMSDTDWLVATPSNTPSMRPPEDPEFGYQPPARKSHPRINDAQMSLFD